jgi:predicted XRE-type DNA-binding protein
MASNNLTKENLHQFLNAFIEQNKLTTEKVARAIDCPKSSVERVLSGQTLPSNELLKQCAIMMEIGYPKYKKLNNAEKEKISESIGSVGGGVLGFGAISSAVSASGVVGLAGGAAITSGLAGLGAIVGGGMAAGIAVAAALPIAGIALGYGMIKGIKLLIRNHKHSKKEIDSNWETNTVLKAKE